jgi:hypothetical protein
MFPPTLSKGFRFVILIKELLWSAPQKTRASVITNLGKIKTTSYLVLSNQFVPQFIEGTFLKICC